MTQLLRFAWLEARSCVFAVGVFAGLVIAWLVPLPVADYDFLLGWCVMLTLGFWALGIETWREVLVICGFHLLGLALEVFKVAQGSWSYPGEATLAVGGVPLFWASCMPRWAPTSARRGAPSTSGSRTIRPSRPRSSPCSTTCTSSPTTTSGTCGCSRHQRTSRAGR